VWSKSGHNFGLGGGYNDGNVDVGLQYFFEEHGSPNNVQYVSATGRVRLWEWVWAIARLNYQTWDQGTERMNGFTGMLGIGARW